jgi:tRNA(Ile)-lysidine synthase
MSITTPALLEVRLALRNYLAEIDSNETILVGCSGGADSLALTYALKQESESKNLRLIPVVIDHDLQAGSADIAAKTVKQLQSWGLKEIFTAKAQVLLSDGLEASARRARYQIFHQALDTYLAKYFFLAHTQNDQAETVLLGLARGSGGKSLSGMNDVSGEFIRPLLRITRNTTEQLCREVGIDFWIDPHNSDSKFTRVRVRKNILPLMERELGPGINAALVRSAQILREDNEALDQWANREFAAHQFGGFDIDYLVGLPKAVRARLLRLAIYDLGAPAGTLSAEHLSPIEALITDWKGQGEVSLPGGVKVSRISGRLSLSNP